MVEVYNFENLIKIQVQMSFGSDSAKLLLKDDILIICISLACCGCYFVLLAFEKSGILGPILALLRAAKYEKQSREKNQNQNNLKVTCLKLVSKSLYPDKVEKIEFFYPAKVWVILRASHS